MEPRLHGLLLRIVTIIQELLPLFNMREESQIGHLVSGTGFVCLGLWFSWNISHKYLACILNHHPYVNEVCPRSFTKIPIASISLAALIILLLLWNVLGNLDGMTRRFPVHMTIYGTFLLYCLSGMLVLIIGFYNIGIISVAPTTSVNSVSNPSR